MKLLILLLGLPFAFGYEESYKGFNNCGVDGFSCNHVNGKTEIIYSCSPPERSARIWVWTARFPTGASIFTVRDCFHLEVHMDCTKGLRSTILNQFNVINVRHLEILPPLKPGIFLHDNDQVPHAPPFINFENVQDIKFFPGLFDKAGGQCRYKYVELTSLTLVNVHIERIMKDLFRNQNMDKFVMKKVKIDSIDSYAMNFHADTFISETTFPYLPGNAITIKGENITFVNNTFQKIKSYGLTIRSKEFQFSNNTVEEISTDGLDVLGAKIEISKNVFTHLETGAMQRITPGYSPVSYEMASKFIYNFSENTVKNINPGSLHLNWEAYKRVCSEIIFKNNVFNCSCINLGWISMSHGLGPKISKVKEFYDAYLTRDENICHGYNQCPLKEVLMQIQDVCSNKTSISTICSEFDNINKIDITNTPYDWTENTKLDINEITKQPEVPIILQSVSTEITEKVIPVLSYTENQTSHIEQRTIPIWLIIVSVIVTLAVICLGIFMWCFKKRKQRQVITTLYKNEMGADADSLIVINEHINELHDKQ